MKLRKLGLSLVAGVTIAATLALAVSPADAWCRWGRCGWGWRGGGWGPGAIVAGAVLGAAAVGTAAAVAAGPRPYGYGPGPYGYPYGGRFVCPPGYHWGPGGRACFAN